MQGEDVQVKWPDGLLYGAKYLGCNVVYMYKVSAISYGFTVHSPSRTTYCMTVTIVTHEIPTGKAILSLTGDLELSWFFFLEGDVSMSYDKG